MSNRVSYNINDILQDIEGTPNGVGFDVSLTNVYDDIKNAKFEDDDSVSFGVWERDLKKADWILVEKLCINALKKQTKDFQIVGWLLEAICILDGFSGILVGIDILDKFTDIFFELGYPKKSEEDEKEEQKLRILDWIGKTIYKRSKFIKFAETPTGEYVNLYNYEYANELKKITTREPSKAQQMLDNAKKHNIKTIDEVQKIISCNVLNNNEILSQVLKNIDSLNETLKNKTESERAIFTELSANISTILRLTDNVSHEDNLQDNKKDIEEKRIQTLSPREEVYKSLEKLSFELEQIEKHSPSFHILRLVLSWKDKNILEIVEDIKNGSTDSHKLLKFLMS
ncbi:MAG: type VI secretion system ImpA family N-terminal domain-containing protein [Alphaproteobacteria bacterium]|nr:type VI secretion system ImpA family N-terminal domain-containing protein [Alphaproteobacteria bacterium]